jgi:hypothetical protein
MTPEQKAHMNFSQYATSHELIGFPTMNPKVYNDLIDRARKAGAALPAGPLPPKKFPELPGRVIGIN